jgi:hypothetical protein
MSDHGLRDRQFRFAVAGQLWDELQGIVSPAVVAQIADDLDWFDSDDDLSAMVVSAVESRGFTGIQIHQIASLVLMAMFDRYAPRAGDFSGQN